MYLNSWSVFRNILCMMKRESWISVLLNIPLFVYFSYVLWLMDCSHDSSRCHAAMFFSQAFPFQVILQKFDRHDGLRRLCNVVRLLWCLYKHWRYIKKMFIVICTSICGCGGVLYSLSSSYEEFLNSVKKNLFKDREQTEFLIWSAKSGNQEKFREIWNQRWRKKKRKYETRLSFSS